MEAKTVSKHRLCHVLRVDEDQPWKFNNQTYKVDSDGILRHYDIVEKTWVLALGIRVCEIINNADLIKRR